HTLSLHDALPIYHTQKGNPHGNTIGFRITPGIKERPKIDQFPDGNNNRGGQNGQGQIFKNSGKEQADENNQNGGQNSCHGGFGTGIGIDHGTRQTASNRKG